MAFQFSSTPQQQATPQPSPFQIPSAFQQSSPFQPQQQQQQQLTMQQFQPQQQQQQQQQQLQQQQQSPPPQMFLFTTDKTPASYGTKWADLHPDSQKILLQIEERILEHRDESQRLDQCSRLYDSSISNYVFEHDASRIVQELGGISTSMERQKAMLHELMAVVKDMLRNTEVAIRSFMILRPRFTHPNAGGSSAAASAATVTLQASGAAVPPGSSSQPAALSIVPVFDFYNGIPKKPSPFLQQTVARFEKYLSQCRQWIEELEQLLLSDSEKNSSNSSISLLQSLPKVMTNVHDFFVHVASKVESIHQYIESMRTAYLADQRRRGDGSDPFLEADRREMARQEAAAKRAHPTLHLSPNSSQPLAQVAGLLPSSGTPSTSTAPSVASAATLAPSAAGTGFSLFSTPSAPSLSMPTSVFATPNNSAATPLQSTVGSSSASLFASSSPSLFGTTTSAFSSTPAGTSLFSTPFASGAAIGGGASFGTTSRTTKPKSRTSRR